MAILNEIDSVRRMLRVLDRDFRTRMEVLDSIKRSDFITGLYAFENRMGRLRFVHSKVYSPAVGDRFWERREKVPLEHKEFYATRRGFVPWGRAFFSELKWKVEEDRRRAEEEYRRKREELEARLRELEDELRRCYG